MGEPQTVKHYKIKSSKPEIFIDENDFYNKKKPVTPKVKRNKSNR